MVNFDKLDELLQDKKMRLILRLIGLGLGFGLGLFLVFQVLFLASVIPHGGI